MTQAQLLQNLTIRLQNAGVPDAGYEAKQILMSVLDLDATSLLLQKQLQADERQIAAAAALADRRACGEPLQYLLGTWDFLDESFLVGSGVLIPRPETEDLVMLCEKLLQGIEAPVVFDLCAGSGCIGLSLLKRVPAIRLILIEYSDEAMSYLRKNADRLSAAERVQILHGDVLLGADAFPALPKADLIVSNPPYIPSAEIGSLQLEVRHEPRAALDGGTDGLDFYRCFSALWTDALKPDGCFAFECGEGQGEAVAALFQTNDFLTKIRYDFNGFDRFVLASRGRKDAL